jgi:tetratricopeptide (TPR) repeat protein
LGKQRDQPTPTVSKAWLIEQIRICLRSSDYARALDLLRGAAAEFPNDSDTEWAELEKLAHDGVKRNAEANRLITESQDLFAQRKSAEAIQLLRQAYELDKKNSLARSILANALVEHAQSVVETDWLQAETLTNQALNLNPAHPTAKTILSRIVARKETSSAEDWVSQARRLQSAGDLFAALAWVAEGLAVHPHDPKLLQIQDEIQRDQEARRRQARRGDLEDLRRLQREIDGATDVAAKQALAARIQALAAKHWTDGEILSIANALLLRLGLVSKESSSAAQRGKGATLILHVPRPSAPEASRDTSPVSLSPIGASQATTSPISPSPVSSVSPSPALPSRVAPNTVSPTRVPQGPVYPSLVPLTPAPPSPVSQGPPPPIAVPHNQNLRRDILTRIPPRKVPTDNVPPDKALSPTQETPLPPLQAVTTAAEASAPAARPKQPARSNSAMLIVVSAAAIILIAVATTFFFTRKHYAAPVAKTFAAPTVSDPDAPAPAVSTPYVPVPTVSAPAVSTASPAPPVPITPAPALSVADVPSTAGPAKVAAVPNQGALVVVAGQDGASVFLSGKLQRQVTQAGQLRLPNLELKDYVVQVSKTGFQDPPPQKISIRKGEPAKLIFNLQPQPRLASLTIQGGVPGTTVLVDQTLVGTIQPDGTLSVSTVNPGDHTVELRKERFKPRQFKKHFVVSGTISLAAADAALEAAPSELKITFTPADAAVAIVKGDLLKMVSSGVPLNLAPGTYTLTARTAERFTRSSTLEVIAGQSKTLDLSLAPNGMSKWDDPGAWKHEGDTFTRKGGDFVFYGVVPASGTYAFSAVPTKGRFLQWVFNYTDPKNYVLFQVDDNNFYRTVIRNGQKSDEIIVPDKSDKKSFRALQIRVTPTEIVHQIKHGDRWSLLDRWTQPGANLSLGKFGFYIPGSDQVALSSFSHYVELNIH